MPRLTFTSPKVGLVGEAAVFFDRGHTGLYPAEFCRAMAEEGCAAVVELAAEPEKRKRGRPRRVA